MKEKIYTIKAAAQFLDIPEIGAGSLYWYLRELKIIGSDKIALPKYSEYFTIEYGTKNPNSPELYIKTMMTEKGMQWLIEKIKPVIIEMEKQYLAELKK